MRDSRIKHPPGGRLLLLRYWAVESFGFAAAAVLGLLDWLDRSQEQAGEPVASRTRIVAELEGVVGRNAVDHALQQLCDRSLLIKLERQEWGGKNYQTRHLYGLDINGINAHLDSRRPDFGTSGIPESGHPVSPNGAPIRDATNRREKEKTTTTTGCCFSVGEFEVRVNLTAVEIQDGWGEALRATVEHASSRKQINPQAYSVGILKVWRSQGSPDRTAIVAEKKRMGRAAEAVQRQQAAAELLESQVAALLEDPDVVAAGQRFLDRRASRRAESPSGH